MKLGGQVLTVVQAISNTSFLVLQLHPVSSLQKFEMQHNPFFFFLGPFEAHWVSVGSVMGGSLLLFYYLL